MKSLILAFQLLTRFPIRVSIDADLKMYARAQVFYPICGLAVGVVSLLAWFLGTLVSPSGYAVAALFAAIAIALITGAMHLDGLADSADGLLSSRKPERMLEIMKDSRMGVMGAMALVFDIAARIIFVCEMREFAWLALLIAPCAAKTAISAAAWSSPYARKEGLGQSIAEYTKLGGVILNLCVALACGAAVVFTLGLWRYPAGWAFAALPLIAGVLGVALARLVTRRLGGITGDIFGAINEIVELLILCTALAFAWR